jgi:hypothetical protein
MKTPDEEGFEFYARCCIITGFKYHFISGERLNHQTNKLLEAVEYLPLSFPMRNSLKYLLAWNEQLLHTTSCNCYD